MEESLQTELQEPLKAPAEPDNSEPSSPSEQTKPDGEKPDKKEASAPSRSKKKHPPKRPPKKRQKTTAQMLRGLLIKVAVIVLAVWLLLTFVLGITIHYGNNMYPAIRDGDLVISFRLQKPYINAAVLYDHDGKTTVGRVIAMEGSVVDVADNGIFTVNDIVPAEEVFYPTFPADGSSVTYPYTVEPGKVFILNDFREDTNDSRSFGAVDVSELRGNLLLTMRRRGF